jgi:CRP-like cAMP-binding protein
MELPEGDIVEVGLMGSEGIVGLDLLYRQTQAVTTVIAQIPGTAARMSAHDFLREVVDRGGPFYALLLRYARAFLGMVSQCAACNASHSVEQRFARWLLMVHDRVSRDDFPLTHEFAALMLGVRRASVTQAASMLRQAGAIDYKVGEVTVCDRKVLEAVTCGCYVLMREMAESVFENEHGAGGVSLYSFDQ